MFIQPNTNPQRKFMNMGRSFVLCCMNTNPKRKFMNMGRSSVLCCMNTNPKRKFMNMGRSFVLCCMNTNPKRKFMNMGRSSVLCCMKTNPKRKFMNMGSSFVLCCMKTNPKRKFMNMGSSFVLCCMNTSPQNVTLSGNASESFGECPVRISTVTTAIFMIFLDRDGTSVRSRHFPSLSLPSRYSLISPTLDATHPHSQIARKISMVRRIYNSNYSKFN